MYCSCFHKFPNKVNRTRFTVASVVDQACLSGSGSYPLNQATLLIKDYGN
jgi:hypothetical protein